MDNYIVSARKYRPHSFATVVGQTSVTKTLKNAVQNNRLAHAYLFCGPRGVGKTSIARIFAKTINCLSQTEDHEACGECESCTAFNENRSYNIHELDAASKNKVEDIHYLIDQVRIAPQIGKYSVYIIDEVHMLSSSAFNAFLKTLEEPPSHAIFVLATTEKHKILPTIISRCQVFDFNRITVEEAVDHLKFVAEKENITAEDEALHIIAQKADGGMRDALSIFDQIASFSGGQITYQQTILNLNVLDYDYFFKIVDHGLANEISDLFLIYDEILAKGFDGQHFITGLAKHMRNLLVSKNPNSLKLLDVSGDVKKKYMEQAEKSPVNFLFKGLKLMAEAESRYRASKDQRLTVELMLYEIGVLTIEKKKVVQK
jgi:DNA polymerase-3 subunit gamma/tau